MKPIRQVKWFEKFYWFISSEGFLVLGYPPPPYVCLLCICSNIGALWILLFWDTVGDGWIFKPPTRLNSSPLSINSEFLLSFSFQKCGD